MTGLIIAYFEANQNIALLEFLNEDTIKLFLIKGHRVFYNQKFEVKNFDGHRLIGIMRDNVLLYFKDNDATEISRDQIDESQIIYSYLKSKDNSCKHVIFPQKWIDNKNDEDISNGLNTLLGL